MVHQPLSSFGYSKFTDSQIALEEMRSVRNDLYEVLAKNSGKPIDEVIDMCEHGDRWMKPDETIAHAFADQVLVKKP
jgi:ATP-dependent protease ClpP protease subunit